MRSRSIRIIILLVSLLPLVAQAQLWGLQNGDMESWRRGFFRCCGRNVDLPASWGIPEQSCGINFNKFVFLEEDSHNIHSGLCAALLYSDTTFFNDIGLQPGMLVYGGYQDVTDSAIRIGQPVPQYGLPIDSNPTGVKFWLKMSHDLSDTFSYMYLLTRWDSASHHRDTLAFSTVDIPDTRTPQDQYFEYRAGLRYLHTGKADSIRMIMYGGRFGNPALATNETWIDDIALIYDADTAAVAYPTGIADTKVNVSFKLYPNPAANIIRLQTDNDIQGDLMQLYDGPGRIISQIAITSPVQAIDISHLATGAYLCRILDSSGHSIYHTRVIVGR